MLLLTDTLKITFYLFWDCLYFVYVLLFCNTKLFMYNIFFKFPFKYLLFIACLSAYFSILQCISAYTITHTGIFNSIQILTLVIIQRSIKKIKGLTTFFHRLTFLKTNVAPLKAPNIPHPTENFTSAAEEKQNTLNDHRFPPRQRKLTRIDWLVI